MLARVQGEAQGGPVAIVTVMPNGPIDMRRNLAQWFVFLLVVGIFVALVTSHTLPPGTPYPRVFKVAATVAFIAYSLALASYRSGIAAPGP